MENRANKTRLGIGMIILESLQISYRSIMY